MNIPSGKQIVKNVALKKLDYANMLSDLIQKRFNGYLCLTINDKYNFEDSLLVFEDGAIKGAYSKFLNYEKEAFGDSAISIFLNNLKLEIGNIDVFSLTKEQTELILTFNEKMKTTPINDTKSLNKFVNSSYKENFMSKFMKQGSEDTKYSLFKQIGLGNLNI